MAIEAISDTGLPKNLLVLRQANPALGYKQSVGSRHSRTKKLRVFRKLAGSARRTRYTAFAIVRGAFMPM